MNPEERSGQVNNITRAVARNWRALAFAAAFA
jgi:hypothetical protein